MQGYVKNIRSLMGHQPLILNSASGALLNNDHQVLLQERVDTGDWGFPGGYLEYGETFIQAAVREFKEDAGVYVRPVRLLQLSDNFQYEYPNGDKVQPINCFYLVKSVGGHLLTAATDETSQLAYFNLDFPPKLFNAQHVGMLKALKEYVDTNTSRSGSKLRGEK